MENTGKCYLFCDAVASVYTLELVAARAVLAQEREGLSNTPVLHHGVLHVLVSMIKGLHSFYLSSGKRCRGEHEPAGPEGSLDRTCSPPTQLSHAPVVQLYACSLVVTPPAHGLR